MSITYKSYKMNPSLYPALDLIPFLEYPIKPLEAAELSKALPLPLKPFEAAALSGLHRISP